MSSEARTVLTGKTPWGLVLLLGSLTAMGPLAIDMYLPSLPSIATGFHASSGSVSVTLAAFFAGLGIGQFGFGPISDRLGRRGPLIFGMALYVAGAIGCALAPSVGWLILARFLQAVGGSAGQVIARASVRDRFGHREAARVLSLLLLVLGLAPIIAPIFGGYLLVVGSWRWIFWFQATMSSLVLIAAVLRFDESRSLEVHAQSKGDGFWKAYRVTLANPRVIGFTLAGAFNSGAFFSWLSLASYLLIEVYRISPQNFGWWFGANAAGFIGMSQVNAHLLRWRTPEEVLVRARLASVVSAVVLVIDAFSGLGGMLGVIIPLYVTLGSFGLVGPNTQAAAMNVDPTRTGTISSIVGGASFAMGALISSLTGFLHVGGARPLAALILFMIVASSAALYGLAKPSATHHAA